MKIYTLEKLVAFARTKSPFYAKLYETLPKSGYQLVDVPVATPSRIAAVTHGNFRELLTGTSAYGMYNLTSATTGKPKITLFGREEWRMINQLLAETHWRNGVIRENDRIANLSVPGSPSFMAVHQVVNNSPGKCSEVPIGPDLSYAEILKTCELFEVNTLAAVNSTFLSLADELLRAETTNHRIERLLGGGELLYGTQLEMIGDAFPNAKLCPFLYGAAEAGMIGYSDLSLDHNVFRVFSTFCKVEILDPISHVPILERGRSGMLAVTNFVRTAAPAIRYAVGDLAEWIDSPESIDGRFRLTGRLFPFPHHVGKSCILEDNVWRAIKDSETDVRISKAQLHIKGTFSHPFLEFIYSVYKPTFKKHDRISIVQESLFRHIPGLVSDKGKDSKDLRMKVKEVAFPSIENGIRRKGRLIVDSRT